MQFTIIRPGGLKTQPATGRGVLTEDVHVCGAIHREDVADLLVHALFSDKTNNKVSAGLSTSCPPLQESKQRWTVKVVAVAVADLSA